MRKQILLTFCLVILASCALLRAYDVEMEYKVPGRNVIAAPDAPRLKVDVQKITDVSQYTQIHGQYTPHMEGHDHKHRLHLSESLADMVRTALIETLDANMYTDDPSADLATSGKITYAAIALIKDKPADKVRAAIDFEIRVFHRESGKTTFTHKYKGDVTVHVRKDEHLKDTVSRALQGALDDLMHEFVSKDLEMYRAYKMG